jgi:hypothetical protein
MVVKVDELIEAENSIHLGLPETEKLSDILEREWPQEQYIANTLHNGDKFCVVGKMLNLTGAYVGSEVIPVIVNEQGGLWSYIEKNYGLSVDQVVTLISKNNVWGRDAAINQLREWGM